MKFKEKQFYYIQNQGNNKRKVFYSNSDYNLFLYKMMSYIRPFADIKAFCILPDQFHMLLYTNFVSLPRGKMIRDVEALQKKYFLDKKIALRIRSLRIDENLENEFTLYDSISIIQRSYCRAINIKHGWCGSLFRSHFKIEHLYDNHYFDRLNPKTYNYDIIEYYINYIQNLPIKADLCELASRWKYSSAYIKN